MRPLSDHVYFVGIVSLDRLAMFLYQIQLLKSNSASETRFRVIKPYYTYSMIAKNICAEIFFQINCLYFLSFGRNKSVFKKQDFTPKFSVVQKCIFGN